MLPMWSINSMKCCHWNGNTLLSLFFSHSSGSIHECKHMVLSQLKTVFQISYLWNAYDLNEIGALGTLLGNI